MTKSHFLVSALALLGGLAASVPANADPCAGGGSLTITASSDSLTLAPVATTSFNFGEHVILTAAASGFTIASRTWTVDGPTIKDYNEDLGTQASPAVAAPTPWSTTPLTAADLAGASVNFYWVPTAAQFEPNNGPFNRIVLLTVAKNGGGNCTASATYSVERNETAVTRQAEDFYTSNHRSMTTTNPGFGHVVDEHIFWHQFVGGGPPNWLAFLPWHGELIRRFDLWRVQFGYKKVVPWYPGRALPTGPQFDADAGLRLAFVADNNRIPTYYTIAGGSANDPNAIGTHNKLADYSTLPMFSNSFESSYHGNVHCNIGAQTGSFFGTAAGPGFGSMCNASSPKDPMFWRWHGFIDVMYRNFCALHPGQCPVPSPADPSAKPWMADNAMDIANNGTTPSPGTHWISPDVWNRRALVSTDACVAPVDTYGDHDTSGGVVRNCGSDADHENPVSGVTNFLYGTLRNTRPESPRVVYAEVSVYYALASSGLTYPGSFTRIPESRQFIALHLEPGTTTSIGPIPWTPPAPPPANDHYCLYLRVLSVQTAPPTEGMGIDADVANNNTLAWRNVKVVPPGDVSPPSFFAVRNIGRERARLTLRFEIPRQLVNRGADIRITFDKVLTKAFTDGKAKVSGLKTDGKGRFQVTGPRGEIIGLLLAPRQGGQVKVEFGKTRPGTRADVTITQLNGQHIDGGVTLRLAGK